jgi:ribose transport system ATP-binding protein
VLVLDEPTSSLTRPDVMRLFELMGKLKSQGHAIIYISHFIEEVKQVADRFVVLRDGQSVGAGRTAEVSAEQIVALMVGRTMGDLYPRSARIPGEVMLEVNGLTGAKKPQHASLAVRRGEVVGISGLVGAGRTEFFRALFGLDPVRAGTIRLGLFSGAASPERRWRQGMGLLSEDRKCEGLALSLSIADNLTLSQLEGFGPGGLVLPDRQTRVSQCWVDRLAVRCRSPRQKVADLSGGNQQKVALARLLQHGVDVLLLDEPTRGIDVAAKALIYELIDQLATGKLDGRPRAIVMISSYLPELLGICDRIAVMCRGRLGEARPVAQCHEHQLLLEATGA